MSLMAAGAAFGALTSYMSIKESNKALAAEAQFNIEKYEMDKALGEFAQFNNQLQANEISSEIAAEAAEAGREVTIAERKALGDETIRRGEGITAGSSVGRSVDSVIQQGNKAKADVQDKQESSFVQVQGQARQANAQEQANIINSYNNLLVQNTQLEIQQVTGLNALLQIGSGSLSGASSGANLSNAIG